MIVRTVSLDEISKRGNEVMRLRRRNNLVAAWLAEQELRTMLATFWAERGHLGEIDYIMLNACC